MHDIKAIRRDPKAFDAALARRGVTSFSPSRIEITLGKDTLPEDLVCLSNPILRIDDLRRHEMTAAQETQSLKSALSAKIGREEDANLRTPMIEQSRAYEEQIANCSFWARRYDAMINNLLSNIPNRPLPEVPDGTDETHNVVIECWGDRAPPGPSHEDIGARLGMLDAPTAVAMSGQRFTMLTGLLAKLERRLGALMVEHATDHGYLEVSPPLIVSPTALYGTGQLPKFAEDLYWVSEGDDGAKKMLIPTAEVPLTNIVRDQIITLDEPRRYTALTPCFRAEAGSAGRDTTGLIRQHQFQKCELVSICRPEQAEGEFLRMIRTATSLLRRLELPYRVMSLCAGDMGFSAQRTFDLEVWFPSQQRYREISSISMCGDFQARRLMARFRPGGKAKPEFVNTLNGSGVAVGRALAAILENFWDEELGVVQLPPKLDKAIGVGVIR